VTPTRFPRVPRDQSPVNGVRTIKHALIFGIDEDGTQNVLDVLQRRSGKVSFFSNCPQQSTGIHGSKFSHSKVTDTFAKIVALDFVVALAGAGSTLLFGPRQVSSLNEGR
jgi:hypothetical protein